MNEKKKIVLKIGGSLCSILNSAQSQSQLNKITKFANILIKSPNVKAVIIGGGKLARIYINAARILEADESSCDTFGIEASRLNARLLITALGDKAYPEPIINLKEARSSILFGKILVAGGFIPGQSTTSVTFEIAESIKATNVLILTDVDGIYDKDPNKYPDAKKFDKITISQLEDIIFDKGGKSQSAAGEYRIFDAVSLQILKRNNINTRLANGGNFKDLEKLLIENKFDSNIGTKILR